MKSKATRTSRSPRVRTSRSWSPSSLSVSSEWSSHNDADRELLGHFGSYEHRESPFIQESPYRIVNESNPNIGLPKSVVVFINMHGQTAEPFITPLHVTRNIGTDFGTCFFGQTMDTKAVLFEGLGTMEGAALKKNIKKMIQETRCRACEIHAQIIELEARLKTMQEEADAIPIPLTADEIEEASAKRNKRHRFEAFEKSKHHEKERKFKKGMPMFNKLLGMTGPSGKPESHETRSIYVRADLPTSRLRQDLYFEIRTEMTTLKEILFYLATNGVTHVTLFDLSCQGDERESIHRKRYGGH